MSIVSLYDTYPDAKTFINQLPRRTDSEYSPSVFVLVVSVPMMTLAFGIGTPVFASLIMPETVP